ncbi:hypothetical protein FACS1894191_7960 [Clostridia bacterium]|nr:hypothetical protein FACS1894191_7960 [Clostridia bacterium]
MRIYRDILGEFCRASPDTAAQIRDAMEQRDYALYTTVVHGVKSALRSIGAEEMGNCAANLEAAGNRGDTLVIEKDTERLLEGIGALTEGIGGVLARWSEGGKTREDAVLSKPMLEAIKTSLIEMDISTVNKLLMDGMDSVLNDGARSSLLEIEKDILLFEYANAIAKIDALL